MPEFIVLIGSRELHINALSIGDALDFAVEKYPGEMVKGYSLKSDGSDAPDEPDNEPDESDA